jgi:hypothetical protein
VAASENAVMTHRYQLISSVILAFLSLVGIAGFFRDNSRTPELVPPSRCSALVLTQQSHQ